MDFINKNAASNIILLNPNRRAMLDALDKSKGAFDGMTNGEVIIAVFPTAEIIETTYNGFYVVEVWFDGFLVRFRREWWNAKYKKGDAV